ncbi:Ubiquitin-2 like Rad60 SUMO-like [Carpediemonas membranifera]|uniref:Ubiquitin-2 like Rad60 SUMO-like n=1 Tax=Carpediemonas membranifera TaxID=201153 RepID=A0A8J6E005_9EUKA|nr:Ubiquitin-2 like Rad60 SUMO-like [Carpediemonas membranifera]|eukprot:KAG9391151.1 Ubiquitin-2 like Rad60 SUMO-like [Carpediemonas membranifera]
MDGDKHDEKQKTKAPADTESADGKKIRIKVRGLTGEEVYFSMKAVTPMKKLFDAYCKKNGLDQSSVRFTLDGERIGDEATAKELDLQDGDLIEVMHYQVGGM